MPNHRQLLMTLLFVMIAGTCRISMAKTLKFSCIEGTPDVEISRLVLAEAYGKLGIDITIQELPGLRALIYANEGSTDGELFRAKGLEDEYTNLVRIHVPINSVDVVAVTKSLPFEINGWQSLKQYSIGIQSGISFIESSISNMKELKITRVKNSAQLMRMLENERIDVVVAPRISAILSLSDMKSKTITILEPPLQSLPLFHYLNKKHHSLVPELEGVLQKMADEGEIERIRDEYISSMIHE